MACSSCIFKSIKGAVAQLAQCVDSTPQLTPKLRQPNIRSRHSAACCSHWFRCLKWETGNLAENSWKMLAACFFPSGHVCILEIYGWWKKIWKHFGCPKRSWYWDKTNISGILSGAGFFLSPEIAHFLKQKVIIYHDNIQFHVRNVHWESQTLTQRPLPYTSLPCAYHSWVDEVQKKNRMFCMLSINKQDNIGVQLVTITSRVDVFSLKVPWLLLGETSKGPAMPCWIFDSPLSQHPCPTVKAHLRHWIDLNVPAQKHFVKNGVTRWQQKATQG